VLSARGPSGAPGGPFVFLCYGFAMKKALVLLLLLGVGGYFAWAYLLRPSEKRACAHLVELCSDRDPAQAQARCDEYFDTMKKQSPQEIDTVSKCVREATSCGEAVGCQAGGALRMGLDLGKGLLNGMQKALEPQK
jgi:hypothetical protein